MIDYTAHIHSKIVSNEQLTKVLHQWEFKGQKVVFTNGCFDILHQGHVDYLAKAASLGHKLVVGLNSDNSVSRLKGTSRPINPALSRAVVLAGLEFVSVVVVFEEDTPLELIKNIKPQVLVKGGDYTAESVVGREYAHEVCIIPLTNGFSTTGIVEKLKM